MKRWITTWGYEPMDYSHFPIGAVEETQCIVFQNNASGDCVRILFSNAFSTESLSLEWVRIAEVDGNMIDLKNTAPVTLRGSSKIVLAPWQTVESDEIRLSVHAGKRLAILSYLGSRACVATACSCFPQDNTIVTRYPGERGYIDNWLAQPHAANTSLLENEPEHQCFYGVAQVSVEVGQSVKTLACYGDSITHRSLWTAPLAKRLYELYPGTVTMVNHGISGNRLLHDESPYSKYGKWFGRCGRNRFEQDVFSRGPVDCVMVQQGINDIFHPLSGDAPDSETVSSQDIIAGLMALADIAHARGARACCCTIMPFKDAFGFWNPNAEQTRAEVNNWLRSASTFDACFDFDLFIRDPEDPARILPDYDSGDHVHPGPLGGERIAAGIDLSMLAHLLSL